MITIRNSLVVVLAVLLGVGLNSCRNFAKKPDLKKAERAEMDGNFSEALMLFTDALIAATPVLVLPDVNRSKFLKPDLWKKEVGYYNHWIVTPEPNKHELFKQALDGVTEHRDHAALDNRLLHFKISSLDKSAFSREWNKMFFTQNVKVDPEHKELIENGFTKNMSFLRITSPKSYSYFINILDPVRTRRVEAQLFPESSIIFMVAPGEYYFICKSTVTFESGQIWTSPYTIITVTIPEKSSLITANLMTSVSR